MAAYLKTPPAFGRRHQSAHLKFAFGEAPPYDHKALPWEGNPAYDEAMALNAASPDGGYVHDIEVYKVSTGSSPDAAIAVRTGKTAVVDEDKLPANARVKVMTDADLAALNIPVNPVAQALSAYRKNNNKARKQIKNYTLPSDRDLTGDLWASLEKYLPDLSATERAFIIEKMSEGWSAERLKELLRMSGEEMKRLENSI